MYCDFKCTIWERINIPTSLEEKFKELLIKGDINSANEAFGIFGSDIDNGYELLLDTSEPLSPEENDGQSTIELYDDLFDVNNILNESLIWSNKIEI